MILKQKLSLQEIFSMSYLFLIILGIVLDVIYFKILGVNILDYSSLSDVLISPIKLLVHDTLFAIFNIFFLILFYSYYKNITKWNELFSKHKYLKYFIVSKVNKDLVSENSELKMAIFLIIALSCMLFGFRLGAASKVKTRMKNYTLKYQSEIEFEDIGTKKVSIIGVNSGYIFYIIESSDKVSISPIGSVVKRINH